MSDTDKLRSEILLTLAEPRQVVELAQWLVWPHRRKAATLDAVLTEMESQGLVVSCTVNGQAGIRRA